MQRQGIPLDEAVHIHATPLHQVLTERDVFGMLSLRSSFAQSLRPCLVLNKSPTYKLKSEISD